MPQRNNAKRFRSILVALAITLATNFAISVVANASSRQGNDQKTSVGSVDTRSGVQTTPATPIRPRISRSGNQTTPPPPPKL